jgi:uncharacterized protein (DUF2062 family)
VPLVVGSQILGVLSAVLGYLLVDGLWRNAIKQQWRARKKRRLQ